MNTEEKVDIVLKLVFLIIACFLLSKLGHTTEATAGHNSIGSTSYTVNPNVYLAVDDIAGANDVDGNLNLRVHPRGTYMLYEDTVLICGHPREAFEGIGIPFLLTYKRQASHSVRGVGCHDLVDVSNIVSKEIK
jgi:hypothetical protein